MRGWYCLGLCLALVGPSARVCRAAEGDVTLTLRDVALNDALAMVAAQVPLRYHFAPEADAGRRLTATLIGKPVDDAVRVLLDAAGMAGERDDDGLLIRPLAAQPLTSGTWLPGLPGNLPRSEPRPTANVQADATGGGPVIELRYADARAVAGMLRALWRKPTPQAWSAARGYGGWQSLLPSRAERLANARREQQNYGCGGSGSDRNSTRNNSENGSSF